MAGAGSTFVSAGGNYLKCWDMVAAKVLTTVSNHQKTITGVFVRNGCSSDAYRLIQTVFVFVPDATVSFSFLSFPFLF